MIFVPPAFCGDAILEAADAGIKLICAITEGVPVQDMVKVRAVLDNMNAERKPGGHDHAHRAQLPGHHHTRPQDRQRHIGPTTRTPTRLQDRHHARLHQHARQREPRAGKAVGIVSRSGTLTYEAVWQTSNLGPGPVDLHRHRRRPGPRA